MSQLEPLINFTEITMGQSPRAEDVNEKGVGLPLLNGPTEFTDRYPVPVQFTSIGKKVCKKDDILFCVRGSTTGRMNYADQPYVIGRGLASIRGKNGYPTPYIKAIIEYKLSDLLIAATGSTFPNVGKDLLARFLVPKLSPKEAQAIGKIITNIEEKIYNNRQMNETLEGMAQALFKSWFVDFDPVRAKVAVLESGGSADDARIAAMQSISGRSPEDLARLKTEAPECYAELAATADAFPAVFTNSPLGDMPEGWEVKNFGSLLQNTIGGDWGKESIDDKHTVEVKIFRGTDLDKLHAGDDSAVPTRFVEAKKLKTRKLEAGDIVIEVSGGSPTQSTGRSLFITQELLDRMTVPCAPASFCRLFRPIDNKIGLFLGIHLRKIYDDGKMWGYQNQSTGISNFQTTVFLENEHFAFPDEKLLIAFFKKISPIFSKLHSTENKILAHTRDALLPKLLSGEIDVSNLGDG